MSNKSPKAKVNSLVPTKKQQNLTKMFAGSSDFVRSDRENERALILLVAKSYQLPAMCVNILGGMPYINKDGLLYKLNEYEGSHVVSLTSQAIQSALVPGDRAIYKSTLVLKNSKGRVRTFNATGEADNLNVKLDAVKNTPNMMAETRSVNRVISKAIKARILKDLYTSLGKVKDDDQKAVIEGAVQTTAEEMNVRSTKPKKMTKAAMMKLSLEKIQQEDNSAVLVDYRKRIGKSPAYTAGQRKTLYNLIDQKIKNAKTTGKK